MFQSLDPTAGSQHTEDGARHEKLGGDPLRARDHLPHHAVVPRRSHGTLGRQGRTSRNVSTLDTIVQSARDNNSLPPKVPRFENVAPNTPQRLL